MHNSANQLFVFFSDSPSHMLAPNKDASSDSASQDDAADGGTSDAGGDESFSDEGGRI
jgi:hypothetical protein